MTEASPIDCDLVDVRRATPSDIPGIIALCRRVYVDSPAWAPEQLAAHQAIFPAGQFVAVDPDGRVLGFASSLIVRWDDYDSLGSWRDFTDSGTFANHDPAHGHTLYGAEVMVDPSAQGCGLGKKLYAARRELCTSLGLWRIRAGARLRGYARYASAMSAQEYVAKVVAGELADPTLSFQISQGFHVLEVVPNYLRHDPESLGWAALIEWIHPAAPPEARRYDAGDR